MATFTASDRDDRGCVDNRRCGYRSVHYPNRRRSFFRARMQDEYLDLDSTLDRVSITLEDPRLC